MSKFIFIALFCHYFSPVVKLILALGLLETLKHSKLFVFIMECRPCPTLKDGPQKFCLAHTCTDIAYYEIKQALSQVGPWNGFSFFTVMLKGCFKKISMQYCTWSSHAQRSYSASEKYFRIFFHNGILSSCILWSFQGPRFSTWSKI